MNFNFIIIFYFENRVFDLWNLIDEFNQIKSEVTSSMKLPQPT